MEFKSKSSILALVLLASLYGVTSLKLDIEPRQIVAFPNQNVTILCRAGVPLMYCRITLPGQATALTLTPKTRYNREYNYYGSGLEFGQCGVNLPSVSEKFNGPVICGVGVEEEPAETTATMQLTVARSPNTPDLDVTPSSSRSNEYREGEQITATCLVKDGRPVATITWFLGDEQIYTDKRVQDIVDPKTDLHTAVQNLTRRLNWNDNGKQLKCVGGHLAYGTKKNTTVKQMLVRYAPRDVTQPIEQFGYLIGQTGEVVVEILANPQPQFTWMIGNNRITEGDRDASGKYEAAQAEFLGSGKWKAILFINTVESADVQKDYYLKAKNQEGEKTYRIVISTSPQPPVMALGAGVISGIVVSILVILLIVILIIFARATGRWCFAASDSRDPRETEEGPKEDDTLLNDVSMQTSENNALLDKADVNDVSIQTSVQDGEGKGDANGERAGITLVVPPRSDTESADHPEKPSKPKQKSFMANFFRKKHDKVAADPEDVKTMPTDDEKDSEKDGEIALIDGDKKDIVYAELDLKGDRGNVVTVKPDDDKTEYAEIIHTQK